MTTTTGRSEAAAAVSAGPEQRAAAARHRVGDRRSSPKSRTSPIAASGVARLAPAAARRAHAERAVEQHQRAPGSPGRRAADVEEQETERGPGHSARQASGTRAAAAESLEPEVGERGETGGREHHTRAAASITGWADGRGGPERLGQRRSGPRRARGRRSRRRGRPRAARCRSRQRGDAAARDHARRPSSCSRQGAVDIRALRASRRARRRCRSGCAIPRPPRGARARSAVSVGGLGPARESRPCHPARRCPTARRSDRSIGGDRRGHELRIDRRGGADDRRGSRPGPAPAAPASSVRSPPPELDRGTRPPTRWPRRGAPAASLSPSPNARSRSTTWIQRAPASAKRSATAAGSSP